MDFKLFKNRNFLFYVIGRAISIIGDQFLTIATALYILSITGSAAKFATVIVVSTIPLLVLGPIAGSVVDRIDRKKMIIFIDILRGILLMVMFSISMVKQINEIEIYILAFIFGLCESFYSPTDATIIPSLVEQKDLVHGNLISQTFFQISGVISPALAALMYSIMGLGAIFMIDGISFFIISVLIMFIKLKPVDRLRKQNSIFKDIIQGLKLYKDKEVFSISINGMLTHLLVLPVFLVGFPFLIKNLFNGSDVDYGVVQTVYSIGTLFAVLTVPIINKFYKGLKALNSGMIGMTASIVILFLIVYTPFSNAIKSNNTGMIIFFSVVAFIFSASFSTYGVFYNSFNQRKINNQILGRFYSMLVMLFALGRIIGNKLYGSLFDTKVFLYPLLLALIGMVLKIVLNFFITAVPEAQISGSEAVGLEK